VGGDSVAVLRDASRDASFDVSFSNTGFGAGTGIDDIDQTKSYTKDSKGKRHHALSLALKAIKPPTTSA
jgi:hypothetical protein